MYDLIFNADMILKRDGTALGGSEATLFLVAKHLVKEGVKVGIVSPTVKKIIREEDGYHLLPLRYWSDKCDIKVFIRQSIVSPFEVNKCEKAYSWLQDYSTPEWSKTYVPRIFNSNFLKDHIQQAGKHDEDVVIYNAYDPRILEHKQEVRNKGYPMLLWNSAWEKGLDFALKLYESLLEEAEFNIPLRISRPKWSIISFPYPEMLEKFPDLIKIFDYQSIDNNWKQIARSTALFRPSLIPETFGIVFAEANALGVPVLTCDVGAAKEVLTEGNFIIDDENYAKTLSWLNNAKNLKDIKTKPEFSINKVIEEWMKLLNR